MWKDSWSGRDVLGGRKGYGINTGEIGQKILSKPDVKRCYVFKKTDADSWLLLLRFRVACHVFDLVRSKTALWDEEAIGESIP